MRSGVSSDARALALERGDDGQGTHLLCTQLCEQHPEPLHTAPFGRQATGCFESVLLVAARDGTTTTTMEHAANAVTARCLIIH